jgi:hypothetical protein
MCAAPREPDNQGFLNGRSDGKSRDNGWATFAPNGTPPLLPPLRTEPPWRLPGQPGAFDSDVTTAELGRISPKTLIVAQPPDPPVRRFGPRVWFIGAFTLIASSVGGYMWGYAPRAAPEGTASVARSEQAILATREVSSSEAMQARIPVPRLTVDAVRVWRADELALLIISCTHADADDSVVVDGLAPGSVLLAGVPETSNAWRLASMDLDHAVIRPPRGFVGIMNLTLELRRANDTVADRRSLQLEWSGPSAPPPTASAESAQRHLDASEIALLMKRGTELAVSGNIGAARLMLQPAAEAGEPSAAFALAQTYDPSVLEKLGAKGITADVALAQRWYDKAKALGSTATPGQLVGLTR